MATRPIRIVAGLPATMVTTTRPPLPRTSAWEVCRVSNTRSRTPRRSPCPRVSTRTKTASMTAWITVRAYPTHASAIVTATGWATGVRKVGASVKSTVPIRPGATTASFTAVWACVKSAFSRRRAKSKSAFRLRAVRPTCLCVAGVSQPTPGTGASSSKGRGPCTGAPSAS